MLTQGLNITKDFYGYDLINDPDNQFALLYKDQMLSIEKTPRIGISAGTDLLWRFVAVD